MRLKAEAVFELWADDEQPQLAIVSEYRGEYKSISGILDEHPEILEMAHQDLEQLSKATTKRGRKAEFTSENLLRAVIVMQREGWDYREATVRIAESNMLQNFCRLRRKQTLNFTLLNRAFGAIRPETWERMNHVLALGAVTDGAVSIDHVRTDTTVTGVQYPLADRLQPSPGLLPRHRPGNQTCDEDTPFWPPMAFSREQDQEYGLLHRTIFEQ